jgi:GTP-binding protein
MRYSFVDEVVVQVRSGDGGRGCVAFLREKFIPFGGPNGGNGGRGGAVIVKVDAQLGTLLDYRFTPRQFAEHGQPGMGSQCTGRDGAPCIVRVPPGTVVFRAETGVQLCDLQNDGQTFVLARGGRGGKGNEHFKNAVRQAPKFAQPGEPGETFGVRLELKLLADVGLVGLPNVGKSSLIARISASKPKIANYPFTTLVPNLGVVRFGDMQHYVVADVPGLVVGAHLGQGLGNRFLRHVERVRCIAHLLTARPEADDAACDPIGDFLAIEQEMLLHNAKLAAVPRFVVLNQIDLPSVQVHVEAVAKFAAQRGLPFFPISAATGQGVQALVNALGEHVSQARAQAQNNQEAELSCNLSVAEAAAAQHGASQASESTVPPPADPSDASLQAALLA